MKKNCPISLTICWILPVMKDASGFKPHIDAYLEMWEDENLTLKGNTRDTTTLDQLAVQQLQALKP